MALKYADVVDKQYDDMSHAEARLIICRNVGLNTSPRTVFGKRDLNSIYRYMTGNFAFPKEKYYTPDSPSTGELRLEISSIVGLEYNPGEDFNRPFRLDNVRELAKYVEETPDQRATDV